MGGVMPDVPSWVQTSQRHWELCERLSREPNSGAWPLGVAEMMGYRDGMLAQGLMPVSPLDAYFAALREREERKTTKRRQVAEREDRRRRRLEALKLKRARPKIEPKPEPIVPSRWAPVLDEDAWELFEPDDEDNLVQWARRLSEVEDASP